MTATQSSPISEPDGAGTSPTAPEAQTGFVHLRIHSAYSLSEGAIRVKDLVKTCADHGMPAVALADRNNLFGGLEFSLAAKGAGVQPIPAVLLGVTADDKRGANAIGQAPPPDELLLIAKDQTGLSNLLRLSSAAFLAEEVTEPQVTFTELGENSEGIICLTGGLKGPVGRLLSQGQDDEAEAVLERLMALFPDRLYVELMRHGLVDEDKIEPALIDLAYKLDLPLVATNDCFFPDRKMYEAHDALLCIAEGTYVGQAERRRLTPEHCFKTTAEMRVLFADIPEAIDNTLAIAQRCSAIIETEKPLLPVYTKLEGRTEEEALRDLSLEGLKKRLDAMGEISEEDSKPYYERLDYELGVINQMGFPGYFLIVADFIQWSFDHGIPVGPGRGSGAGSVVAWALTITNLDPLRFNLLFERFLNPERVSMPDFDIDFCQDRRDEVIRYVQREYGTDRVAQIITFGKLQARAVLRDVGRVLEMPYGQVDRICKLVPNNPAKPVTLQEAIDGEPLLQEMKVEDPAVRKLIDTALPLEGLYRHASTHAAGVVIGDRPLTELTPLYRDPRSDMPVTQYNMKYVEQAGLVKFDFLGLKTLTVIERARELINQRPDRTEPLDIDALPLDDAKTFDMLCKADTVGVFQLESSGMRDVLKKLRPDLFEEIIAVVSLYRPGPMDNIPSFIKRKHGEESPNYPHPKLEPVLQETYGIPVYQEQVMQMAQVLAGYTLGGADLLRRAMGKKVQSEMDAQRKIFVDGALEVSGVESKQANEIFDMINAFAGYGFNKSHAAAYALVAYQTGWLKANYPVEFLAASMTLDIHNTDKLGVFRAEIDRQGIELLPPDVNKSHVNFSVERDPETGEGQVRYALAALKNVGSAAMESIVKERENNGPFKDIFDFASRLDPRSVNKKALENLAKAGAFDGLVSNRKQLFNSVDVLAGHAAAAAEERESNQVSLFGDVEDAAPRPKLSDTGDWNQQDRLSAEFEAIGFYLSAHPLEAYEATCKKLGVVTYQDLIAGRVRSGNGATKLAGIVGSRRIMNTSRGSKMAFVGMSDASGAYEITLFQEVLNLSRDLLDAGEPLLVVVDVQSRGEGEEPRLTALSVKSLESEAASAVDNMDIHIDSAEGIAAAAGILKNHGKRGRGKVKVVLKGRPLGDIVVELDETFKIDAGLRKAIKSAPGVVSVQDA